MSGFCSGSANFCLIVGWCADFLRVVAGSFLRVGVRRFL